MRTSLFKRAATMLLATGLMVTSCTDDNTPGREGGEIPKGEMGYMSFSLVNSNVRTKADAFDGYGTAAENAVNEIYIVLYENTAEAEGSPAYEVAKLIALSESQIGTVNAPGSEMVSITPPGTSATTYHTKAQTVEKKPYKLAVFVNPPSALKGYIEKGDKLSDMETARTVSVSNLTGSSDSPNFLMSNFIGLVDVTEDDIYSSAEEAEKPNNKIKLEVERAVAKVTLNKASDLSATSFGATIGDILWNVDVVNKKTFWMRNVAMMLDPDTENYPTDAGDVADLVKETDGETQNATPGNRKYMYATDPNWDNVSKVRPSSKNSEGELTDEFDYTAITAATLETGTSTYVTENTMHADDQFEDVTTGVLIAVEIIPATSFFGNDLKESHEYFLFKGMVFTRTEMQEILAAYDKETTATITTSGGNKVWNALVTANPTLGGMPAVLNSMSEDFGDYADDADKLEASLDITAGSNTVRFYADALNHYFVPIRHFDDSLQPTYMAYGRHGVVRNNWYMLTLNSVKSFGTATLPDHKDPDDKEGNDWLSVEFHILPWLERTQGIGL